MPKYKVYQVAHGNTESESEREQRLQIVCDGNINQGNIHLFEHVANVEAECMPDAFEIMNLWQRPELVTKLTNFVRSLSVGDILVDEDGVAWVVANFGFDRLKSYLASSLLWEIFKSKSGNTEIGINRTTGTGWWSPSGMDGGELIFEDGQLVDYDGCYELPLMVVKLVVKAGYKVEDERL